MIILNEHLGLITEPLCKKIHQSWVSALFQHRSWRPRCTFFSRQTTLESRDRTEWPRWPATPYRATRSSPVQVLERTIGAPAGKGSGGPLEGVSIEVRLRRTNREPVRSPHYGHAPRTWGAPAEDEQSAFQRSAAPREELAFSALRRCSLSQRSR